MVGVVLLIIVLIKGLVYCRPCVWGCVFIVLCVTGGAPYQQSSCGLSIFVFCVLAVFYGDLSSILVFLHVACSLQST